MQTQRELSPEEKIVAAIIECAIDDLRDTLLEKRRAASAFLAGDDFRQWCTLCGLEPQYIAQRARKIAAKR